MANIYTIYADHKDNITAQDFVAKMSLFIMAPFRQEKQRQSETSTTAVHLLFIDSEGWPVVLKRLLFVYSAGVSMKTMKIPRSLGFF